ncbi:MAG: hypothetical protein WC304_00680 [Candidatus Gracilibacteria bacterium]|jgi:hypothetical protein
MHRSLENREALVAQFTSAEIEAAEKIERRGVRYGIEHNCQGNKRVLETLDRRNFVKPKSFSEINPQEKQRIINALTLDWEKRFIGNERLKPIQHLFEVDFPINSGYTFRLICILSADKKTEIMHPFKEMIYLN